MTEKAIVFSELLTQIPDLRAALSGANFDLIEVNGGKDAAASVDQHRPVLFVLDVAMPQMSGIECCRQLKESAVGVPPKVVLISAIPSTTLAQRAQDAGCDLFAPLNEAPGRVQQFLNSAAARASGGRGKESEEMIRGSARVEVPGKIKYTLGDQALEGDLMNASRTGVLFAARIAHPPGVLLTLKFMGSDGADFEIQASVVRTLQLKEPRKGLAIAVGAKFENLGPDGAERVQKILNIAAAQPSAMKLSPEVVRRLLEGTAEIIRPVIQGEDTDPPLKMLLGEMTPAEIEAFSGTTPTADCIRRLVLHRVQCNAFFVFLPTLQAQRNVVGAPFLNLLKGLLANSDAIEEEVNGLVKLAVNAGDEPTRQTLNGISSTLYQAKVKLLYGVNEKIPPEGLGPEAEIVKAVADRVEHLRSLKEGVQFDLKYARRAPPPPPVESAKAKGKSIFARRNTQVAVGVMVLVALGIGGLRIFGGRVSKNELQLSIPVESAMRDDNGINVVITRGSWNTLPSKLEKEKLLDGVQAFLEKNRLLQAKVLDENGRLIAAILGGHAGRKIVYSRRITD